MALIAAWTPGYLASYVDALEEGFHMGNAGEGRASADEIAEARADLAGFAARASAHPEFVELPDGQRVRRAPTRDFWWVDGGEFVGAVEVRTTLPCAMYAAYGGHISLGIRASRRGRRNGNHYERMFRAALTEASRLGVERVLCVCRTWNRAAQKGVLDLGGIWVDEVPVPYSATPDSLRRYVVPTAPFAAAGEV